MRQILIFGLSGQVGDALLPLLHDSPCRVTAVSRLSKMDQKNIVWQQAGFIDFEPANKHYDAIVSLGPLDAFSNWLTASQISTEKIIALSSTSIVTKKNSPDPAEQRLSLLLNQSEQKLISYAEKKAVSLFVLRPTLIYGTGRDQSVSRFLNIAKRYGFVVLPTHAGGLRQPVHVIDVAGAVFSALSAGSVGKCFLDLPGGETIAFDQMLLRCLQVHAPGAKVLRIPDFLLQIALLTASFLGLGRGLGPGFFARLSEDWLFDAAPAGLALDYQPRAFSP
jgi:nucleoside-diphosphate-sugar epimerase